MEYKFWVASTTAVIGTHTKQGRLKIHVLVKCHTGNFQNFSLLYRFEKKFYCYHVTRWRLQYVTAHSTTFPPLHLRHSPFYNLSAASPTSQLILQPFRRFTYVTAHSTTFPPLHLRHSSFYNLSAASSTSQLILQPFRRFTYVTAHSTTFPPLHLRHWRAAHDAEEFIWCIFGEYR